MALAGPLSTRRRIALVGLETVERGQPVVPATPLTCYEAKMDPKAAYSERKPTGPSAGNAPGVLGAMIGTFTCRADLRGSGTSGLDDGLDVLLQCCGFNVNGNVYTPESVAADQKTCTIYLYEDGMLKVLSGCAGTFTLDGEAGQVGVINFDMSGVWTDVTYDGLPQTSPNATLAPRFVSAAMAIDVTYSPFVGRFSLNMGNNVSPREDVNSPGGVLHYVVADRSPVISLDMEAAVSPAHDPFALWLAGTPAAFTCRFGAETGNAVAINAPAIQYREIAEGDRGGKLVSNVQAVCCYDEGDDDVEIDATVGT